MRTKPITKRELKQIISRLGKARIALAKERDALRDLLAELEEFEGIADDAIDSLSGAIDRLSEQF